MINRKTRLKIKVALINNNTTQIELAKKMGVSKQQLNNVLNGLVENLKIEERLLSWLNTGEISPTIAFNKKVE